MLRTLRNLRGPLIALTIASGVAGACIYTVHHDQAEEKRLMRRNLKRDLAEIDTAAENRKAANAAATCETGLCDLKADATSEDIERARAEAAAQFDGRGGNAK